MKVQVFDMLRLINSRLDNIETNISRIDEKLDFSIQLQRNHLIRTKNGEDISDDMILYGRPYNDLTPERGYKLYQNPNIDFIVLDVSHESFKAPTKLDGTVSIPLEDLQKRYSEISSKTTPILVISENGLRSITACELLVKKGYFNINNISGGHDHWPGHTLEAMPSSVA